MNIPFTIVRSPEDFPSWIAGNEFGFDTETTGLDYATDTIVGISLSCKGKNYYIPVIDHDQCLPTPTIIDLTTKLFTHPDSVAIGHNSKFDTKMLLKFGIQITCKVHDTLLAAWLLNEKRGQHGLKYLEKEILGFTPPELNFNRHTALNYALNTVNAPDGQRTLPGMEGHRHSDQLAEYAAIDAFGTYAIWKTKFEHELGRFTHLYDHLELPYSDVLRRMEMRGTYLNRDLLRQWRQDLEHRDLPRLREHIYKEAGTRFNIESNSELAHILFDVRKLPVNKYTGKGQRAVDKEVLQEFADHYGDPLPAAILEYRALQKILSTYVIPLYDKSPYGRVHCSFNQTGTVTGRLCVSKDTLVEAPRDMLRYPDGVPITELSPGDWVYSYTWDRRLCLKRIKWVGKTGVKPTITIKAIAEDGHTVELRLTESHLVRLYNGRWVHAGFLKPGNRLMCMVKRGFDEQQGYYYFYPSSRRRNKDNPTSTTGGKCKEHRFILAQMLSLDRLPSKWDVHHKDGNKANNYPGNLEKMMHTAHLKMHRPKTTPEQVQAMLDGSALTVCPKVLKRLAREYGLTPTNHTVIEITRNEPEEVWDLEVEDTHTFIANGIAIHNSSSEPNLQNVVTRKDGDNYNIRQAFIPTPGYGMVVVDYSALELRVLSHFILEYWGDESALVHAIQQGLDAHTYMASVLYNQPYNTVTKDQRSRTKSLTFGLMYGMGPKKLAKSLNLSYSSARSALDDYFKQFPDIRYVQSKLISQAKYDGVVRTILGHERRFTSVEDSPETEGLNALIQGSAADIVKLAQIKIDQQFTPDMHQLIQVHDEVVCEAPLSQIQACADIVQHCMENAYPLNVPLVAEPKIVSNWSEAK
jgi:DNA polymerase I-like protein with 3'-5' exonuclease and polymerase domains